MTKITQTDLETGESALSMIADEIDREMNPNNEECWYCSGEGETFDCIDGCCANAEDGCYICRRVCPECLYTKAERAKKLRYSVIELGNVYVAAAWIKSVGRWNDDITAERIMDEMEKCRVEIMREKQERDVIDADPS